MPVVAKSDPPASVMELVQLPATEAHDRILEGLPLRAVLAAATAMRFTTATTAAVLGVQPRTLRRWKSNNGKILDAVRGSRFYRVTRVFQAGVELFGSPEATVEWFCKEQRALDHRKPMGLMTTDAGAIVVEELLTRIRYNAYT